MKEINIVELQENLINKICIDYNLNYNELYKRYIKNDLLIEMDNEEYDIVKQKIQQDKHNILEKVAINKHIYYIENHEGGAIYNKEVIKIGEIKNNSYIFF